MNKLLQYSQKFKKFAAVTWPEETQWVPETFKQLDPFKKYPFAKINKEFEKHGLKDFKVLISEPNIKTNEEFLYFLTKFVKNIDWEIFLRLEQLIIEENKIEEEKLLNLRMQNGNFIEMIDNYSMHPEIESLKLKTNQEITIDKRRFPTGSSIFKVINYIIEVLKKFKITINPLESTSEFKKYSLRVPNEFYIVFSTQVKDLVGISDRGIKSCMSLIESGKPKDIDKYNKCLVGTILSKYVGVIYLTPKDSEFFSRGERMLYRSLVRIIYDTERNENIIYIDKMYPGKNEKYLELFKQELQKRSSLLVLTYLEYLEKPVLPFEEIEEKYIPKEYESYTDFLTWKKLKEYAVSNNFHKKELAANNLPPDSQELFNLLEDPDGVGIIAAKRISLKKLRNYLYGMNSEINKKRNRYFDDIKEEYKKRKQSQ